MIINEGIENQTLIWWKITKKMENHKVRSWKPSNENIEHPQMNNMIKTKTGKMRIEKPQMKRIEKA